MTKSQQLVGHTSPGGSNGHTGGTFRMHAGVLLCAHHIGPRRWKHVLTHPCTIAFKATGLKKRSATSTGTSLFGTLAYVHSEGCRQQKPPLRPGCKPPVGGTRSHDQKIGESTEKPNPKSDPHVYVGAWNRRTRYREIDQRGV